MRQQVFIRKREEFDTVSGALCEKIEQTLHIHIRATVWALYEVEGLSADALTYFQNEVLGDKVTDIISNSISTEGRQTLAYTFLAGHFDQRAYYALQAGRMVLDHSEDFTVRSSTVLLFEEPVHETTMERIRKFLINPVDTRERSLSYESAPQVYTKPMSNLCGFSSKSPQELKAIKEELGLTMDSETLSYVQQYYRREQREATETELFLFDTYWSDHCRHTTFLTPLRDISFRGTYRNQIEASFNTYCAQREEIERCGAVTLMDLATHSARYLKAKGKLTNVELSEEINACSVHVDDEHGRYLLMFKNETHNHPTEIEPFGGAQTCLGGAIRDPLSGRSFVYQGIRISGGADPTGDVRDTIPNKLPQSTIARESARGFSSYGNQIGMATTLVKEIYHPTYVAKHLELGAVVGITPVDEVRRETPCSGDLIILLGGKTGKDGIGGASGSSIAHTSQSLDTSYAQIQKGNPLEERKLQRLFRIPEVKRMIKRSNDFGAGGVSVAIGELAPGLIINLDAVPLKTKGMNATEIAISESQERMAVVIDPSNLDALFTFAHRENVEATLVAEVTDENRLVMNQGGRCVVDISRDFLDTNGPIPTQEVLVSDYESKEYDRAHYERLNGYSQKGLGEIFDSSVGNSTIFAPYGGTSQCTPELSSVQRFPLHSTTSKASVVSYGFDPVFSELSPYIMGMNSVLSSVAKQIATGAHLKDIHLSLQEYFPKPGTDPEKWGLPLQALLGAFEVCNALSLAMIGGKDSMSGTYEGLDVVPTLVSFAFSQVEIRRLISRAFKAPGEYLYILRQQQTNGIPDIDSFKDNITLLENFRDSITSISTLDEGLGYTLEMMSIGNEIGYTCYIEETGKNPGGFLFTSHVKLEGMTPIGKTTAVHNADFKINHLKGLKKIYPFTSTGTCDTGALPAREKSGKRYYHTRVEHPRTLILTFSGTNSELDMEMNFREAGADTRVFVIQDTSHEVFSESVRRCAEQIEESHILVLPGGFSFSDEPDGSGKFIATFLRHPVISAAVERFLAKDHLILGICNGFQGLIKSGLLPYGSIRKAQKGNPTLFFNDCYHHVSRLTETKIHSSRSPWLQELDTNRSYTLPVSHSEGRFIADEAQIDYLIRNDLIATTYLDNPNGSTRNIEGIMSIDGNILGKMAHNERIRDELFVNVGGNRRQDIFMSGVRYFSQGGRSRTQGETP